MPVTFDYPSERRTAAVVAAGVIRVAALYVLAGALAKLLWGSPADLPAVLRDHAHGGLGLFFELVVGVEIFVAVVALLAPRIGWPFVTALLLVFLVVLGAQLGEGAESCGCFGSEITIPPWIMLVVDGVLAIAVIGVRPWRSLRRQGWRAWSLAVASLAGFGGFAYLGTVSELPADDLLATDPVHPIRIPGDALDTIPGAAAAAARTGEIEEPHKINRWKLPEHLPRYVILAPDRWIDKRISATALATWADTAAFSPNARIIFYYDTCDHCADHLRYLADEAPDDDYVLVQLPTGLNNRNPVVVDRTPEAIHVALPSGTRWMIKTPWEVRLEDGVVVEAEYLGEGKP